MFSAIESFLPWTISFRNFFHSKKKKEWRSNQHQNGCLNVNIFHCHWFGKTLYDKNVCSNYAEFKIIYTYTYVIQHDPLSNVVHQRYTRFNNDEGPPLSLSIINDVHIYLRWYCSTQFFNMKSRCIYLKESYDDEKRVHPVDRVEWRHSSRQQYRC